MRYMIIGDLHGSDLYLNLEDTIMYENPDFLVCLGDFDQVSTIRQFMEIEKRLENKGKKVIKVPGNHDYALLNHICIDSGTFKKQGKSFYQLVTELNKDTIAKNYLDELVNSREPGYTIHRKAFFLDKERFGDAYKTIVIHGAYDGDISSAPNSSPEERDLWFRLTEEEDYEKNFRIMEEKGYTIMIRGHDHEPIYSYYDKENGIVLYAPDPNKAYRLFKKRKHIINPGALFNGWFALIDTNETNEEVPILKYRRLNGIQNK
ncbi:MAG: metallophosphoesterase [Candidatus Pacearchaeota archaeon]|nr:metallophosphoesterase [Candidatus Pacearchaeota archaeon]